MKNNLTLFPLLIMFCGIIFIASCTSRKDTAIAYPGTESNNSEGMLEISKVELADTATVLYFDCYQKSHPENWFRIDPNSTLTDSTGKMYKITGCEGITLGKQERTPESGHVAFTIAFEPIGKDVKKIDFKEGDNAGDFQIKGIKLYKEQQVTKMIQCVLKGEIINRPYSSRLALAKFNEDWRVAKVIYIPIRDGKFEYTLNCDDEEMYELAFSDELQDGAWRPIKFISEQGVISFTLYPMDEYKKNQINGGTLNSEYKAFEAEVEKVVRPLYNLYEPKMDSLWNSHKYFSAEAIKIQDKINLSHDKSELDKLYKERDKLHAEGRDVTPEGRELDKKMEEVGKMTIDMQLQYAKQHPSIVGYCLLFQKVYEAVYYTKTDITPMKEIYNTLYASKYPNHPYAAQIKDLLASVSVKVGGRYVDVTAPDLQGNSIKLSSQIDGKIALIHLWASWCGPCRRHGIEMIPVYEAYKDKGFTIVGIAREKENTIAMEAAIKRDNVPWLNLVELNDKDQIWTKYGLGNGGGGDFLVDKNGVILAISPSAEEVKKILDEKLK